jgi:hypothetical protein
MWNVIIIIISFFIITSIVGCLLGLTDDTPMVGWLVRWMTRLIFECSLWYDLKGLVNVSPKLWGEMFFRLTKCSWLTVASFMMIKSPEFISDMEKIFRSK